MHTNTPDQLSLRPRGASAHVSSHVSSHASSVASSAASGLARGLCLGLVAVALAGCTGGPESVTNPAAVLSVAGQSRERYFDAIEAARQRGVDEDTKAALRRMISADGFAIDARERAFALLYETDPKAVFAALENSLPRMGDVTWRRRVCELVAERKMRELVPTLIRAWANTVPGLAGDEVRPERAALGVIVGEDQVSATLLATMKNASPTTQANLRARCWELLMKTGDVARLRALLADASATQGDAMLTDLARVSNELGVLPTTREEILWARKLCEPSRAAFFEDAKAALAKMPAARREALELRAIPVAVACMKRHPALLVAAEPELFAEIEARIKGRKKASPDFTGYGDGFTETLYQVRDRLVWSDLAAMTLALDVVSEPALRRHLFEVADRDREDRSTEHGGVIALVGAAGSSAELLEFEPRSKASDIRYESPQALFDALYTGLYHVHVHAQNYENAKFAGPHLGDFAFADSSRCNGLVFTFLTADLLDVDFYRHGRLVADLGAIERPQG
jgi:hypothetical protein